MEECVNNKFNNNYDNETYFSLNTMNNRKEKFPNDEESTQSYSNEIYPAQQSTCCDKTQNLADICSKDII